jgi:hypothetical protein
MPRLCISRSGPFNSLGRLHLYAESVVLLVLLASGCALGLPRQEQISPAEGPLIPSCKMNDDLFKWIKPSNDREWTPGMEIMPKADFGENQITVHNIRSSRYRTYDDFDVSYYDKTYDLDELKSVYFIVVPFNEMPGIAHTMLSFDFGDRDYLAVSVEIRREKGEKYNVLKGFLRQYELMYVVADERDVIDKNADKLPSEVFLYRTTATPEQARELFVDVMKRANQLIDEPEFYNTLLNNCTTNIRRHINHLKTDRVPYDYRVLLPGYSDHLAYDLNLIEHKGTFEQTRESSRINYQAYLYQDDPEFSQKIRR